MSSGLKPNTMVHGTIIQITELSHRKHPQYQQLLWSQSQAPGTVLVQTTDVGLQSSLTSLAAQGMQGTSILAAA